jgi:broad specificity phosphatase PhoE
MRLIAVRHGETSDNTKRILRGHGPGNLTKLGIKQAQALGSILKKQKLDFIYCSDLKRCKETLKEIKKYHQHAPVIFTEQLRERNWGAFEGRPAKELWDKFEKEYKKPTLKFKPKNGESLQELRHRLADFLRYLKKNHERQKILIVSHGGALRALNSVLMRSSITKDTSTVKFHNTSISEYEIAGSKVKVHRFNEVKHL